MAQMNETSNSIPWRPWPAALLIVLVVGAVTLLMRQSIAIGRGWFVYPLDDCYIHLSMARNLALHGSWGIEPGGFQGSSSSPLYTLLLGLVFKIGEVHLRLPLLLNLFFAAGIVLYADNALAHAGKSGWQRLLLLVLLVLAGPVITMALLSMEPLLYALLALVFLHTAALRLDEIHQKRMPVRSTLLPLLTLLLVATRFEGLALALAAAFLFWMKRERGYALLLAVCAMLPVAVYALFATSHGGLVLPNAFYSDSGFARIPGVEEWVFWHMIYSIRENGFLAGAALVAVYTIFRRYHRYGIPWDRGIMASMLFGITLVAHLLFSRSNIFFRHEAYLEVIAVLLLGWIWLDELKPIGEWLRSHLARWPELVAGLIALFFLYPVGHDFLRRAYSPFHIRAACESIENQPIQTARFLSRYFGHEAVAVQDIGAVSFFGREPVVDLFGLALDPVMRAKWHGNCTAELIGKVVSDAGAAVAVVYDDWLEQTGGAPEGWVPLAHWSTPNLTNAFPGVTVYATSSAEVPRVKVALKAFSPSLPDAVRQNGAYLETADDGK